MRRKRWVVAAAVGLLGLPLGWADQEFEKLREEFDQAQQKYYEDLQAKYEKDGGGQAFNMAEDPPPIRDYRPKFKALAEKNAGKPEAIEPLVWLVHNGNKLGVPAEKQKDTGDGSLALQTLIEKHAADPAIAESLEMLRHAGHAVGQESLRAFYAKVLKENKNPEAKAWSQYSLGSMLYEPFMFEMPEGATGPGGKKLNPADKDRAIAMFRDVLRDYPKSTAAKSAEPFIFELEKLQVGMTAPDFEGKDLAGKPIKLSDFRGKVVVIDFWGFW